MTKRVFVILLAAAILACALPAETSGREGDGGVDPCEACAYIPAWCGICLIEQWWDSGEDCFPWWPECY